MHTSDTILCQSVDICVPRVTLGLSLKNSTGIRLSLYPELTFLRERGVYTDAPEGKDHESP
jgi:hypothetical protein